MLDKLELHHIGFATSSIEETCRTFSLLGFAVSDVVPDPERRVNICLLSKQGHVLIELIEPMADGSPVDARLNAVGAGAYHFCYSCENLEESLESFKAAGFVLLSSPAAAVALENSRVCFLFHRSFGLIELVEQ